MKSKFVVGFKAYSLKELLVYLCVYGLAYHCLNSFNKSNEDSHLEFLKRWFCDLLFRVALGEREQTLVLVLTPAGNSDRKEGCNWDLE